MAIKKGGVGLCICKIAIRNNCFVPMECLCNIIGLNESTKLLLKAIKEVKSGRISTTKEPLLVLNKPMYLTIFREAHYSLFLSILFLSTKVLIIQVCSHLACFIITFKWFLFIPNYVLSHKQRIKYSHQYLLTVHQNSVAFNRVCFASFSNI